MHKIKQQGEVKGAGYPLDETCFKENMKIRTSFFFLILQEREKYRVIKDRLFNLIF